jgi:hypothetical protein
VHDVPATLGSPANPLPAEQQRAKTDFALELGGALRRDFCAVDMLRGCA